MSFKWLLDCSQGWNPRPTWDGGEGKNSSHRGTAILNPLWDLRAGGLTAHIRNSSTNPTTFIEGGGNIIDANGAVVPNPGRSKVLSSGDTFLTFNYGGGIKFLNVAGPMGFRFDVRGRTLPNFFGETTTWFEPSAGITFSWGER